MPRFCILLIVVMLASAQEPSPTLFPTEGIEDVKLPNGTSQRQAILKAEHKKSLEDSAKLLDLVTEVHADLEKSDANVVSLKTVKQLEEIERLSKRIRTRLKPI